MEKFIEFQKCFKSIPFSQFVQKVEWKLLNFVTILSFTIHIYVKKIVVSNFTFIPTKYKCAYLNGSFIYILRSNLIITVNKICDRPLSTAFVWKSLKVHKSAIVHQSTIVNQSTLSSERPIRQKLKSADTDYRPLSTD